MPANLDMVLVFCFRHLKQTGHVMLSSIHFGNHVVEDFFSVQFALFLSVTKIRKIH